MNLGVVSADMGIKNLAVHVSHSCVSDTPIWCVVSEPSNGTKPSEEVTVSDFDPVCVRLKSGVPYVSILDHSNTLNDIVEEVVMVSV